MLVRSSLVFLVVALLAATDAAAAPPILGALQDQAWGNGECGAELWRRVPGHDAKVLAVNADAPDRARVNVDGHDVFATRAGKASTSANRRGQRYSEHWKVGSITIDIDYVVTRACPKDADDCENSEFAATIRVSDGKHTQTTKATGLSGC